MCADPLAVVCVCNTESNRINVELKRIDEQLFGNGKDSCWDWISLYSVTETKPSDTLLTAMKIKLSKALINSKHKGRWEYKNE